MAEVITARETGEKISVACDKEKHPYRRLLRYLYPYRSRFFLALGAMVLYGATDGAVPFILKRVLDDIFGRRSERMLWVLVLIIVIFAMLRGIFGFLQHYQAATVGHFIVRDLRNDINKKLLQLSLRFFSGQSTGALISRMTNDTLLVRTALTDAAAAILRDSTRVFALMVAAFVLDPVLALFALFGLPIGLYPVYRFGKKVRRLGRVGQDQFGGLTGILQETVVGHKVVQAFTMEDFEQARFERENDILTRTFRRAEKAGALSQPTNEVLASFAVAGIVLYGGLSVISGVRTQGDFIAFITSVFLLYDPLKRLSRINSTVQLGMAGAERIFAMLDTPSDIVDLPGARELDAIRPLIEYRGVWFSYAQIESAAEGGAETPEGDLLHAEWALRGISLTIEPGKTLALVGMSGGGKSTLVNLLPRFFDPQYGAICINGIDIRDYKISSLRGSIAVVDQHTFLFNDTAFHNISYGREGTSEREVIEAAKAANAHDFIMRLPQGYQTIIGEQGFRLSGGERARIAIARALVKNAPILILDEATAALDSESEKSVQEAIDRLMVGRTVLVIAHRLATVRKADRIAVLNRGALVEMGTHDELLARGGEYRKLHRLQFRDAEAELEVQA